MCKLERIDFEILSQTEEKEFVCYGTSKEEIKQYLRKAPFETYPDFEGNQYPKFNFIEVEEVEEGLIDVATYKANLIKIYEEETGLKFNA